MAERIMMTPNEIRDAADLMQSKLEDITGLMSELKRKVDETASRWEGRAKDAYVPMFEDAHANIQKTLTESITGLSEALKAAAQAIESTDAEIAGTFSV